MAATHEDGRPSNHALGAKAKGIHGAEQPRAVNGVIGLGEVRVEEPTWQAQLTETGRKALVVADVVTDVPSMKECGLGDVNDVIEGALEAVGDDEHDELDVTIQESDGAVAGDFFGRQAGFVEEADDTVEEAGERGGGGCVLEGSIEDTLEDRDQ